MGKQLPLADAIDQRRRCPVRRPKQIVSYVPVLKQAIHIRTACGHRITEQLVLTITGTEPKPNAEVTFIGFTLWELIRCSTKRECINCEQQEQLERIIVCASCGTLIYPGDAIILGQHGHETPLAFDGLKTVVVESGDIVRCTSPQCSAHVQHHSGMWNGATVEVPILTRHHSHGGGHSRQHASP